MAGGDARGGDASVAGAALQPSAPSNEAKLQEPNATRSMLGYPYREA
jgi:hypothetical protein